MYCTMNVYTVLLFLQGMPFNEVSGEVDKMLRDLQFEDNRKIIARSLSGGMKRKLR